MNTITKSDFLSMVKLHHLEVLTQLQLSQNTKAIRGYIEKSLTATLSDIEKSDANTLIEDVGSLQQWVVLRDDFSKAVVFTRPEQIIWDAAERGEFGEIIKARGGVYKPTSENTKLGRVGQKYGEKKETLSDLDTPIANMLKNAKRESEEQEEHTKIINSKEYKNAYNKYLEDVGNPTKKERNDAHNWAVKHVKWIYEKQNQTRIKKLVAIGYTQKEAEERIKDFENDDDVIVEHKEHSRGYIDPVGHAAKIEAQNKRMPKPMRDIMNK